MSDFQPGDLVVKVGGSARAIPVGSVRRVAGICTLPHGDNDADGLLIAGYKAKRGTVYCNCFDPEVWRKLNDEPDDIALIERIKRSQPAKETANV